MTEVSKAVDKMIADWQGARAALAEIERAEHPDITDRFGRVWTWFGRSDTYRHCGIAAPVDMINQFGLPSQKSLDNPNSDPCDICLDGRTRNVSKCRPEWKCSHKACQSTDGSELYTASYSDGMGWNGSSAPMPLDKAKTFILDALDRVKLGPTATAHDYDMRVRARDAFGETTRPLKFKVGIWTFVLAQGGGE